MTNLFEGICGRIAPGMCRLSMSGDIAIKTKSGYRTFDVATKKLTNCDSFVLDVGEDFFFVMPTNKVRVGDIILANGLPKCVLSVGEGTITAINFEDATVETLLPEHHMFMGNSYLYGRIVSMFGHKGAKGRKGAGKLMKYMMLSSMLKGKENSGGLSSLMPLMLMGGKMDFMDDLFSDAEDDEEEEEKEV